MSDFNRTNTDAEDVPPADRAPVGRFAPGNTAAMQHGARAFKDHGETALSPELREEMAAFRADVIAEQGGDAELTAIRRGYVRRLVELETMARLFGADLARKGLFTERGHTRAAFRAFLQTIHSWDTVAQRLGLDRRAAPVPSIEEYVAQRAAVARGEAPE